MLKAQPYIELNLAGSNHEGITFNAGYQFHLSKDSLHRVSTSFGMGTNVLDIATSQGIAQGTLNYYFRNWGLGVASSSFTDNPLSSRSYYKPMPTLSIMPCLSYDFLLRRKFYLRASAGPYFTFSRGVKHPFRRTNPLKFNDDTSFRLGISIGKRI